MAQTSETPRTFPGETNGPIAVRVTVGDTLFIVAAEETLPLLRDALRAGAKGFYVWPEDDVAFMTAMSAEVGAKVEK